MARGAGRQAWLAIHRYLGLATLSFLALAAATGCVLCFRAPLDAALNPDLFRRQETGGRLDPVAVVTAFEVRHKGVDALSFPLRSGSGANLPVSVAAARGGAPLAYDQVFLDPADGHVAGRRSTRPGWDRRHLLEGVYLFHYTLLAGPAGRWLMGGAALGWLIGAAIGLYLTIPARRPFFRAWEKAWKVSLRGRLPRVLLDLHQASGLWFLVPVLVLAFTSVAMNFFDEAFTPAAQAVSPAKPSPFDPGARRMASPEAPAVGFAKILGVAEETARTHGLAWRPASMWRRPDFDLYGVVFTNDGLVNYSRLGPIAYVFDGATGKLVYEDNPYADSAGRRLSRALYPLHTGKVAGPAGVAFIFLLGLVTLGQCLTGGYLWWARRGPRIASRRVAQPAETR